MPLTPRQLNRATLARQLLLERHAVPVVDAVRRVVGLQAQEPASPYLALWNRVDRFDPAELDASFADGEVVKGSLMRITLHAVAAVDHPVFRAAMVASLRASRLHDRRFTSAGLSIDDVDALVPHVVAFADEIRSRSEIEEMLGERLGAPAHERIWWALRTFAPVVHAPTGGPWSFGRQPSYLAAPSPSVGVDPDGAVQHLIRRYLEAFGPATPRDLNQFTMLPQRTLRPALEAMGDSLVRLAGPDGIQLLDVPGGLLPPEDTPAPPRLLGMWDNVLLAYADRSRVIPPEYRKLVIRRNGDVLPTILVDGLVAGVWCPSGGGIEVTSFHPLSEDTWDALTAEARSLAQLVADRDPDTYRRYGRWWADLPSAEVRVVPG